MGLLQTALTAIYPPRCLGCGEMVDSDFGLCSKCWGQTAFIGGTICDSCGVPLPGTMQEEVVHCDACLNAPKPWKHGRAALVYTDMGRKLVLQLKHADRQEIAKPAARWMRQVVAEISLPNAVIAPVPLHWTRLAKRRYNQSALIAKHLAALTGHEMCADLLERPRRTSSLDGKSKAERADILSGAIQISNKRRHRVVNRPVIIVDDVMTTGATLAACAEACRAAGASEVCVAVLARVVKDA
ncbi:MAG: ComF family protein [Pseudomonadota bacterium]